MNLKSLCVVRMFSHECGCLYRLKKKVKFPETVVTGGCKPLDMGVGNRTQVLLKSSVLLLTYYSSTSFQVCIDKFI